MNDHDTTALKRSKGFYTERLWLSLPFPDSDRTEFLSAAEMPEGSEEKVRMKPDHGTVGYSGLPCSQSVIEQGDKDQ